ncbi:hypothetical protein EI71_00781 [Anaeroplasma bactoclasticum]|jgi:hypothetical protein|uniref:Uncharacterized protein n=1 Tax=Anaeroplasma bactoclasticum TaxID=2088 RepID=A0A397S083_9MOLU|nr:hypothetical protein [Anaeroplasma bactoclasticum]RIA77805.1 hypothetical protein EI71_00781 [Anaeroplasma bactoclasticum]
MKKNRTEENEEFDEYGEIEPYQVDKFSKIPSGVIITFAKFWAAAAAVFFILIGGLDLGIDFSKETQDIYEDYAITIKAIILVSLFLAILLNYGIKHLAHLMNNRRNNTKKWMVLNLKGFFGFLAYLVYCIVTMIIMFVLVSLFSYYKLVPSFLDNGGIGIEPFSYGLGFILVDGVFLVIKNYLVKLYQYLRYRRMIQMV